MCGEIIFFLVSGNVYKCVCENEICNFTLMCQQIERMGGRDTVASLIETVSVCVRFFLIYSLLEKQLALFPS